MTIAARTVRARSTLKRQQRPARGVGARHDGHRRGSRPSSSSARPRPRSPYERGSSKPPRAVLYSGRSAASGDGGSPRGSPRQSQPQQQPLRQSQPRSSSGSAASKMARRVSAADANGILMLSGGAAGSGAAPQHGHGIAGVAAADGNNTWGWAPHAPPAPPATAAEAAAAGAAWLFHPARLVSKQQQQQQQLQQQQQRESSVVVPFGPAASTLPPRPGTAVTASRGGRRGSAGTVAARFSMYSSSRPGSGSSGYVVGGSSSGQGGGSRRFSMGGSASASARA